MVFRLCGFFHVLSNFRNWRKSGGSFHNWNLAPDLWPFAPVVVVVLLQSVQSVWNFFLETFYCLAQKSHVIWMTFSTPSLSPPPLITSLLIWISCLILCIWRVWRSFFQVIVSTRFSFFATSRSELEHTFTWMAESACSTYFATSTIRTFAKSVFRTHLSWRVCFLMYLQLLQIKETMWNNYWL